MLEERTEERKETAKMLAAVTASPAQPVRIAACNICEECCIVTDIWL